MERTKCKEGGKDKVSICKLQIWDTLGQEKFRCMNSAYYRGADAAIIVYDICQEDGLLAVQSWLSEIHDYLPDSLPIWIIANKLDIATENNIDINKSPYNIVKKFALAKQYEFVKTSAKTDEKGI